MTDAAGEHGRVGPFESSTLSDSGPVDDVAASSRDAVVVRVTRDAALASQKRKAQRKAASNKPAKTKPKAWPPPPKDSLNKLYKALKVGIMVADTVKH